MFIFNLIKFIEVDIPFIQCHSLFGSIKLIWKFFEEKFPSKHTTLTYTVNVIKEKTHIMLFQAILSFTNIFQGKSISDWICTQNTPNEPYIHLYFRTIFTFSRARRNVLFHVYKRKRTYSIRKKNRFFKKNSNYSFLSVILHRKILLRDSKI